METEAGSAASATEAIGAAFLEVVADLRQRRVEAQAQAAAIVHTAGLDAAALVQHALDVVEAMAIDHDEPRLPVASGALPAIDLRALGAA